MYYICVVLYVCVYVYCLLLWPFVSSETEAKFLLLKHHSHQTGFEEFYLEQT